MKYNTIDTIIDDIMNEMRRNNITESESYSRKQIEQWIIQYRMFILKELSNSKLPISSNYYQRYVVPLNYGTKNNINNPKFGVLTTENKVPDYFCNDLGNTFISSYDMLGNEIQIMSGKRAAANRFRRHANFNMPVAYIAQDKKYKIENASLLYFGIASSSYLLLAMTVRKSCFVVVLPPRNDKKNRPIWRFL